MESEIPHDQRVSNSSLHWTLLELHPHLPNARGPFHSHNFASLMSHCFFSLIELPNFAPI